MPVEAPPRFLPAVFVLARSAWRFGCLLGLAVLFPATAAAATYNLPADIGKAGPFSSCSQTSGTLYTCTGNVALGNNSGDTVNFSQSMTLQVNGNFSMVNNGSINDGGFAVLISATGNIVLANNNNSNVNFAAGGNFTAGNNTEIAGNVTAGGTLTVGSGTISGFCSPSNSACQGTNGCVTSSLGGETLVTCTRDGAVTIPAGVTSLRYLVVGGGGGGGGIRSGDAGGGGGGGGGAVRAGTGFAVVPGTTHYIAVGTGGAAGVGGISAGGSGSASSFAGIFANGGSGGASQDINAQNGVNGINGGSAGGGRTIGAGGTTGMPRPPNGYPGGHGAAFGTGAGTAAGGGGGAGSAGGAGIYENFWLVIANSVGGDGGSGLTDTISGASVAYGGGGGGGTGRTGTWFDGTIAGGDGRDGGGNAPDARGAGSPGQANRGGGGSGATGSNSGSAYPGGAGGSGVVILRYGAAAGPDHIRLLHDGEGLTCAPESITVKACADAACTTPYTTSAVSVTLNNIANTIWSVNPVSTNPATGTVTVTLRKPDHAQAPNPVTLGVAAPYTGRCFIGASENCNMTFHESGFVFDIPHHVAETTQTVAVSALKKSDSGAACVPAFASISKPVAFTCAYNDPASGTLPLRIAGTALNAANSSTAACDAGGQSLNLSFNASGVATITVQYADAGNMTLSARHSDSGLVMTGNDTFIAAPAGFELAATGPFVAGQSFLVKATGRNAGNQPMPNFGRESAPETVELKPVMTIAASATNSELSGPVGGVAGILTAGAFTPAKCSPASAGTVCDTALAWTEVGDLTISAALKSGNYLSSGLSAWGTVAAGTFKPAFLITQLADSTGAATSEQACGTFTYSGQPFRIRVSAMSAANAALGTPSALTRNYTGSYARPVTLGSDSAAACTPTTAGFGNHTLAASGFSNGSAATPPVDNVAPNPLPITYSRAPAAPGPITVCARDGDGVNSHARTQAVINLRNGRLWLGNAYGPVTKNLKLPVETQYWNGSAFVRNSADGCTVLTAANIGLGNYQGLTSAQLPTTSIAVSAIAGGRGEITVTTPNRAGSADLVARLGTAGAVNMCPAWTPAPIYPAGSPNASPWLRGKWCGSSFDRDPVARATFGIFGDSTKKGTIYLRENF